MTHQLRWSENQHPKRRDEEGRAVHHIQKDFSYHTLLSYDRDKYVPPFVRALRHYIFHMMLVLTYCWVSYLNPTYLALSEMQGWKRGFRAMATEENPCCRILRRDCACCKGKEAKKSPGVLYPEDFVRLEYVEMVLL
jgi:hypothetical protein